MDCLTGGDLQFTQPLIEAETHAGLVHMVPVYALQFTQPLIEAETPALVFLRISAACLQFTQPLTEAETMQRDLVLFSFAPFNSRSL